MLKGHGPEENSHKIIDITEKQKRKMRVDRRFRDVVRKLIIFDLDGVLIDTKDTHYVALNKALTEAGRSYIITESEHVSSYDGLSTKEKLKMLSETKKSPRLRARKNLDAKTANNKQRVGQNCRK